MLCQSPNYSRRMFLLPIWILMLTSSAPCLFLLSRSALGWRVHPPTPYCFSQHMLFLVPYTSISMDARHDILELARFLTELSVIDYFFVSKKASSVALASLQNAMAEIPEVSEEATNDFATEIQRVSSLNLNSIEVTDCRERLRLLYAQGGYSRPETQTETRDEAISPVCVSYGLAAAQQMANQGQLSSKGTTEDTNLQVHNQARSRGAH